jgi:D-glycero-D-manno-heptose 1,7-bisphosphate phosphatase
MTPALFLDRDGVINVNHGYVHTPTQVDFVPGIFSLVAAANAKGLKVVVVTNQAGIARGFYTEKQFHQLTQWIQDQFGLKGAKIDATYYCPHHPEHGLGEYLRICNCRKPAPGMLLDAISDLDIDKNNSIMIGDSMTDACAALEAGIGRIFLLQAGLQAAEAPPPGVEVSMSLADIHRRLWSI